MAQESVLEEAQRIIHGDRQNDYGHPSDNHGRTADLWRAYLRSRGIHTDLNAEDVCWMNVLQKISRRVHAPRRDSLTDVAGYVGNIEMIEEREQA